MGESSKGSTESAGRDCKDGLVRFRAMSRRTYPCRQSVLQGPADFPFRSFVLPKAPLSVCERSCLAITVITFHVSTQTPPHCAEKPARHQKHSPCH
jgi:hypothetical protein